MDMTYECATRAAHYLDQNLETIAKAVTDTVWNNNPEWDARFGEPGKVRCLEDARYHLLHLRESVRANSPALFHHYLEWSRTLLESLKIGSKDLDGFLESIGTTLQGHEGQNDIILHLHSFIEKGRHHLTENPYQRGFSFLPKEEPLATLSHNYLDTMLALRRKESCRLILDAVKNGIAIRDIYLGVFQPVQHEVGLLWQTNRISVATEHYCTATTQWVMSQLYPMIFSDTTPEHRVIATSVGGIA